MQKITQLLIKCTPFQNITSYVSGLWSRLMTWIDEVSVIDEMDNHPITRINPKSFKFFNSAKNPILYFNGMGKNIVELNLFLDTVLLPLFNSRRKIYPGVFSDYVLRPTTVFDFFSDSEKNYIDEIEQIEYFINVAQAFMVSYHEYLNDNRSKQQNLAVIHNFYDELNEFILELIRISNR